MGADQFELVRFCIDVRVSEDEQMLIGHRKTFSKCRSR